jgi:putative RNA 2'-phosphotransferase
MAEPTNKVKMSKFLSLILRHKPDEIGLTLDQHGWADIEELLFKAKHTGLTEPLLHELVANSDKQRFALSPDRQKIRANQGHSLAVDLDLKPQCPPDTLYHGTAHRHQASIFASGLEKRKRQHVHLSVDIPTALNVGQRYDRPPLLLSIDAQRMQANGYPFYLSANGVWLVEHVPPDYIQICEHNDD